MNDRTFHHHHAHKLDDPERLLWLSPSEVITAVGLRPADRVADIGAGTGYFALPFAAAVGPKGWVAAVDIQPEMLTLLAGKEPATGSCAIAPVLGTALKTNLPTAEFDFVFLGNVWHELDDLEGVLAEVRRLLRTGGRVGILDWRTDVTQPPGPPLPHRVPQARVVEQLRAAGLQATANNLGQYYYLALATA